MREMMVKGMFLKGWPYPVEDNKPDRSHIQKGAFLTGAAHPASTTTKSAAPSYGLPLAIKSNLAEIGQRLNAATNVLKRMQKERS
jgi:hypothetical protein